MRQSRPARALWIEIIVLSISSMYFSSRPARALGIEIHKAAAVLNKVLVEAREGLVD